MNCSFGRNLISEKVLTMCIGGIADDKGLYSSNLIYTQINAIDDKFMGTKRFDER